MLLCSLVWWQYRPRSESNLQVQNQRQVSSLCVSKPSSSDYRLHPWRLIQNCSRCNLGREVRLSFPHWREAEKGALPSPFSSPSLRHPLLGGRGRKNDQHAQGTAPTLLKLTLAWQTESSGCNHKATRGTVPKGQYWCYGAIPRTRGKWKRETRFTPWNHSQTPPLLPFPSPSCFFKIFSKK